MQNEATRQTMLLRDAGTTAARIYGYRKLHDDLRDQGESCCPNRVARLAKLAGIKAQIGYKRRSGKYGGRPFIIIDNTLDRQFDVDTPRQGLVMHWMKPMFIPAVAIFSHAAALPGAISIRPELRLVPMQPPRSAQKPSPMMPWQYAVRWDKNTCLGCSQPPWQGCQGRNNNGHRLWPDGARVSKSWALGKMPYPDGDTEIDRSTSGTTIYIRNPHPDVKITHNITTGAITKQFLHRDHLSSVRMVSNSAGTLSEQTGYAAYGERLNTAMQIQKGYIGERCDPETGLQYTQPYSRAALQKL